MIFSNRLRTSLALAKFSPFEASSLIISSRTAASKGENFANAREVRNLFEKIITNQASRVSALEDVDEETLSLITLDDLTDPDDPQPSGDPEDAGKDGTAANKSWQEVMDLLDEIEATADQTDLEEEVREEAGREAENTGDNQE